MKRQYPQQQPQQQQYTTTGSYTMQQSSDVQNMGYGNSNSSYGAYQPTPQQTQQQPPQGYAQQPQQPPSLAQQSANPNQLMGGNKKFRENVEYAGYGGDQAGAGSYGSNFPPAQSKHGNPPSAVVHLRHLPTNTTVAELNPIVSPFGTIVKALMLYGKTQGFVELQDQFVAEKLVNAFTANPPTIRGQQVFAGFARHQTLSNPTYDSTDPSSDMYSSQSGTRVTVDGTPGKVVHISVHQIMYPVEVSVMSELLTKYGQLNRVNIFEKNGVCQVLAEFTDNFAANTAVQQLNGKNMYTGCNLLKAELSHLSKLNIKYNNETSFDFTNPNLPPGSDRGGERSGNPGSGIVGGRHHNNYAPGPNHMTHQHNYQQFPPNHPNRPQQYGGGGPNQHHMHHNNNMYGQSPHQQHQLHHGGPIGMQQQQQHHHQSSRGDMPRGRFNNGGMGQTERCVLHLRNLNEERVTPDAIFMLVGVYADVHRVKIMFNQKSAALVEVTNRIQADNAITYLDNVPLFGNNLRVQISKYNEIKGGRRRNRKESVTEEDGEPAVEEEMSEETKAALLLNGEYIDNALHRYRVYGSRNYNNITSPSNTLHLSNLPVAWTEDQIKALFKPYATVDNIKLFTESKGKRMCLIRFKTLDEATTVIVMCHNMRLDDRHHLRVCFSKSEIKNT